MRKTFILPFLQEINMEKILKIKPTKLIGLIMIFIFL